ncbi:MAG TPA: BrnT family toxin [Thermoanaerobaculia bacterium]|nr:BrnT family toxin [Thermoanaerobaculia bacterium]
MRSRFEWDEVKADENLRKHAISFEEAIDVFLDPFSITRFDPDHSNDEHRYVDVGLSARSGVLVVVYTERAGNIRIISCRKAAPAEQRQYERARS